MQQSPPVSFEKIEEMTEGDAEFKSELITAIYFSLQELREKYIEGAENQDPVIIQEIRHKVKPSLSLFDMVLLSDIIQDGKEIIESQGFDESFMDHFDKFLDAVQDAIDYVRPHVEGIEDGA
ncbi:hypothetical protein A33Q_1225 [Indibacter alkaliphilus LW1]|uniref:HPt domain-containing protein n=1 Tax=Indibacter alkaliphilus (strain CCUG 57479 / KCTC 22604 / LW1) TaxID=1189612 RepID=S2E288_INDAL|nr:hypothetical protein [Indibacter alkaliphilus]EOZ98571.1 hypothetical protein A33Q_1225 [Indibacter alkaliphilus LW1]